MSRVRHPTRVLLDTENDFFGFGRSDPRDPEARQRAAAGRGLLFPRVPDDIARCLAPLLVADLVDWIEERWEPLARESYGKNEDPGVASAREALESRGFTHHPVPRGKDLGELAVIAEMEAISGREAGDLHMTLGGGDKKMLDAAVQLRERDGRHRFVAIFSDSRSHRVFGSRYASPGGMTITSMDLIRRDRRRSRRADAAARAAYRSSWTHTLASARGTGSPHERRRTAAWTLGAAAVAIAKMPEFPNPTSAAKAEWERRLTASLTPVVEESAAQSIVGWTALEVYENPSRDAEHLVETLFRAAIAVTIGDLATGEYAGLLRRAVREAAPERLTALERALASWTTAAG